MPRLSAIGFAPAATLRRPSRTMRLGQDGGGRRAVTGDVVGLLGDLLDELGADLLVGVLELDLLGDGDTVVGDGGGAPLLLQDDVAALGAERDLDGVGEGVHAPLEAAAGLLVESNDLGHIGGSSHASRRMGPGDARDGRTGAAAHVTVDTPVLTGPVGTYHSRHESAKAHYWHSRGESANATAGVGPGTARRGPAAARAGLTPGASGGSPPRTAAARAPRRRHHPRRGSRCRAAARAGR